MANRLLEWLDNPAVRTVATIVVIAVLAIMVVNLYCWAVGGCPA